MREEEATRLLRGAIRTYRRLKRILDKYGVSNTGELLDEIKSGKFIEHPTYEDYLEARSYELELKKILTKLNSAIGEMQGLSPVLKTLKRINAMLNGNMVTFF